MKPVTAFALIFSLFIAGCSNNENVIYTLSPPTGKQEMNEYAKLDLQPQPVDPISFDYPAAAKKNGIRGYVKYQFTINELGLIEQIEIIESSHDLLSASVIKTLQNSKFRPGIKEGQPVKVRLRGTVPFGI